MQRKNQVKQSYDKLSNRLNTALAQVNKLTETTPTPIYGAAPDANILKNLLEECEDSERMEREKYWINKIDCVNVIKYNWDEKEYKKIYREKHKEEIKEYMRKYYRDSLEPN